MLLLLPEFKSEPRNEGPNICPEHAKQAFIRLLPQIQRADAIPLPLEARTALHALLLDGDEELVLAVLTALS